MDGFDLVRPGGDRRSCVSGVMAFARGLIREVFSIVAFVGGADRGDLSSPTRCRPIVEQFTDWSGPLAAVAAGLLIFLAVVCRRHHPDLGDRQAGP